MLLERASLSAERFPGLLAENLEKRSLYDVLAERYGTPVVRARELLEPVLLRAPEARLLDVPPGRPALLVEGIAYTTDGSPVEFARSWVRGDQTRYYVERVVNRHPPARTPSSGPVGASTGERSRR
jgi:GntR family transcriptional regulator